MIFVFVLTPYNEHLQGPNNTGPHGLSLYGQNPRHFSVYLPTGNTGSKQDVAD